MNLKDDEFISRRFLKNSKKTLDDRIDSLDAATLSRLNQARQHAIQSMPSGNRNPLAALLAKRLPVAAFSGVAVFAVTAWLLFAMQTFDGQQNGQQYQRLAYADEDIEILVSETELDLLDELEFVSWLLEIEQSEAINNAS